MATGILGCSIQQPACRRVRDAGITDRNWGGVYLCAFFPFSPKGQGKVQADGALLHFMRGIFFSDLGSGGLVGTGSVQLQWCVM